MQACSPLGGLSGPHLKKLGDYSSSRVQEFRSSGVQEFMVREFMVQEFMVQEFTVRRTG
jgi:hypothetical protein